MEARRRVIAHVTAGAPGTHVDVTQHHDAIVGIAGQVFGKPGATVKIVQASGAAPAQRVGAWHADPNAQIAGVLCFDAQTRRTFALQGGDASKLAAPVTAAVTNAPQPLPAISSGSLVSWDDLPDEFKALYANKAEYEQELARPQTGNGDTA
jgi:hypothetical protein